MFAKRRGRILKPVAINQETREGLSGHDGEGGKDKETSRKMLREMKNDRGSVGRNILICSEFPRNVTIGYLVRILYFVQNFSKICSSI